MDVRKIRQMTDKEILDELEDLKEALFKLRFDKASGELKDTNAIRRVRRDVARLKTVLRERQLAAQVTGKEESSHA
jgi:large subunit ribosomal protein L29